MTIIVPPQPRVTNSIIKFFYNPSRKLGKNSDLKLNLYQFFSGIKIIHISDKITYNRIQKPKSVFGFCNLYRED
uniref:Uncharacterized protein n=1 Tax=Cannabis sativa TaxID=3483 RepID=A0A803R175_CANSA